MKAYIDHNFLIDCLDREGWRAIATKARGSSAVRLVLSPWSIYEIGKAVHMEELLVIADELNPSWILERVDLQLQEFVVAWKDFWNGTRTAFDPIRTLSEVHASFFRCPLERVEKYSIRDYASVWQGKEAASEADIEFRRQEAISSLNRIAFGDGKFIPSTIREMRRRYVTRQFAISTKWGMPHHVIHQYENWILSDRSRETFISFFVDFGGMDEMPAHRVEESLTFNQWKSSARLNPNRQVDRLHAIAALPYCHLFVTSDRELGRKSQALRKELGFEIAEVLSGEEFIEGLKNDKWK